MYAIRSYYGLFLNKHYFNLGRVYRRLGRAKDAIEIALQRRELWPRDTEKLVSVAEELVLASELQHSEKSLALAIETLERAVAIGGPLPGRTADRAVFADYGNDLRFSQLFAGDKQ